MTLKVVPKSENCGCSCLQQLCNYAHNLNLCKCRFWARFQRDWLANLHGVCFHCQSCQSSSFFIMTMADLRKWSPSVFVRHMKVFFAFLHDFLCTVTSYLWRLLTWFPLHYARILLLRTYPGPALGRHQLIKQRSSRVQAFFVVWLSLLEAGSTHH